MWLLSTKGAGLILPFGQYLASRPTYKIELHEIDFSISKESHIAVSFINLIESPLTQYP